MADIDGHYGSPNGFNTHKNNYLFGPQVSFPARVSPFFHVLIGGAHEHVDGVGSDSSFAAAIGGGIDTKVSGPFYWRAIQGELPGILGPIPGIAGPPPFPSASPSPMFGGSGPLTGA